MKKDLHLECYDTEVTCACGNKFTVRSTLKKIHADICNACHPFFSGKQKIMDTAGRVDKFNKRYGLKK